MKYFTQQWCFGDLTAKESKKIKTNYHTYIDQIYDNLPFSLKLLTRSINLHDGIMQNLTQTLSDELILEGVFGDLQIGYFILTLKYEKVSSNISQISLACNQKELEILSDEIEVLGEKLFAHRIIFSNKEEIEIIFKELNLTILTASAECYDLTPCKVHSLI